MKQRLIVSVIGIPLLLVVILVLPPWATAVLVSLICAIGAYELTWRTGLVKNVRLTAEAMIAAAAVSLWSGFGCETAYLTAGIYVLVLAMFCELLLSHAELEPSALGVTVFAGVILPLLLTALTRLRMAENGALYIITALIMAFSADSGAYLVGCRFGKHPLAPHISPKKTVEGAIGGIISSVALMLLYALILNFALQYPVSYGAATLYGLLAAPASMLGDLGFSAIKRKVGIKDYGNLLPGHGGIYDRFDSLVIVAPLTELLVLLIALIKVG